MVLNQPQWSGSFLSVAEAPEAIERTKPRLCAQSRSASAAAENLELLRNNCVVRVFSKVKSTERDSGLSWDLTRNAGLG